MGARFSTYYRKYFDFKFSRAIVRRAYCTESNEKNFSRKILTRRVVLDNIGIFVRMRRTALNRLFYFSFRSLCSLPVFRHRFYPVICTGIRRYATIYQLFWKHPTKVINSYREICRPSARAFFSSLQAIFLALSLITILLYAFDNRISCTYGICTRNMHTGVRCVKCRTPRGGTSTFCDGHT